MLNAFFRTSLVLLAMAGTCTLAPAAGNPLPGSAVKTYSSGVQEGFIGVTAELPVDNPADNIFHVQIDEPLCGNEKLWLVYDLEGVEDHTSVSRSINDQLSAGGYLVRRRGGWATQREQISASWLRQGDNVVRFTTPENSQHSYRIKNLRIEVGASNLIDNVQIIFNQPSGQYYFDKAYVKGLVTGAGSGNVRINVAGKPARVHNGEFESIVDFETAGESCVVEVEAVYPDGSTTCHRVDFSEPHRPDFSYPLESYTYRREQFFQGKEAETISLDGAMLNTPAGALAEATLLSITTLRPVDIAPLDAGMENVTAHHAGYRFLPHGTTFSKASGVRIPYDAEKIPDGYTEEDIRTYYFDEQSHHWVPLERDTVLSGSSEVVSHTLHFTDYINAIIKVPESPEVQAYNSTSMKGIKAATPNAAVNLINPPQATSTGSATLNYPLTIPAGRGGMQPQLAVSYNSGGGNGWLGLGWNLTVPAISIDTRWGVPRFDPTYETETYTMNGEQLTPVAHRGALQRREQGVKKEFFPRVEGSFSRVIRHENDPSRYWWEVTDKSGTSYFYGATSNGAIDENAVLRDNEESENADKGHVAYWCLREVRDLNGNGIQYHYAKVEDTGLPASNTEKVFGHQVYIDKITYTSYQGGDGPYTVLFTRDREMPGFVRRPDVSIAGNLGFKMVTADLLRKIEVQFQGKNIRSYELKYKTGEFFKSLLESISEFDAGNTLFTTHTFDYYNEVRSGATVKPFETPRSWTIPGEGVDGGFVSNISGFTDEATALSGTKSTDKSVGATISVGFNVLVFNKSTSVGGSFGYSQSKSDGLVMMTDINGDGLQDKIYARGNKLFYNPNRSSPNGEEVFGDPISIEGRDAFYKEKNKTINYGAEALFGAFVGVSRTNTTSTTSVYLADVNGDQLPDIVNKGVVWFNDIDPATGVITFTRSSEDTPSRIIAGGAVSGGLLDQEALERERQEAIDKSPLHDVVRMWQAPYDGTVKVSAPVQLLKSNDPERAEMPADGVLVTIQFKNSKLWSEEIGADDYSVHQPSSVSALEVKKNDKIFFRVGSRDNGSYDSVRWEPVIEYLNKPADATDANGKPLYTFAAKGDYLLASQQTVSPPLNGKVRITGLLVKPYTTDSVHFVILRKGASATDTVWHKHYSWNEREQTSLQLEDIAVKENEEYTFKVVSNTNIDWPAIKWEPQITYTVSDDPTVDLSKTPITAFAVPEYSLFVHVLSMSSPVRLKLKDHEKDTLTVSPILKFGPPPNPFQPFTGDIVFSVKKADTLLAEKTLKIVKGKITTTDSTLRVPVRKEDTIYVEYHERKFSIANGIITGKASLKGLETDTTVTAGLHTVAPDLGEREDFIFGNLYRGWGHFAWNGNRERATQLLDQTQFKASQQGREQTEINTDNLSGEQLDGMQKYDASADKFIILVASARDKRWSGYDQFTYLTGSVISSSRLGDDDLSVLQLSTGDGTGAPGIDKVSKSNSTSFSLSASVGGVGAGMSRSSGDSKVLTDFMDMNGDRYPDIVSEKIIQYTNATGGLSSRTTPSGGDVQQSHSDTEGYNLSGSQSMPMPKFKSSNKDMKQNRTDAGDAKAVGFSLSANVSAATGTNNADITWLDINGDGLPDRVDMSGRRVSLNIGYGFTAFEQWGFDQIQAGSSDTKSGGAGIGFTKGQGSISGGVSLARSDNSSDRTLQDVNGDGLPDIVIKGNPVKVRLNKGGSFASEQEALSWTGASGINENATASESANLAFTVGFTLWGIKWTVNPSGSIGQGMSRELSKLSDIDGDGFPDYIRSTADNNLTVSRSTIGRTNLLKGVKRPMGATFAMSYARTGNTYEVPNSMWVLDSVKVFDGFKGDGVDNTLITFAYEGGLYDRHEREFYGFKKVITNTHDTGKDSKPVYTTVTQTFLNDNYYERGLKVNELMTDGSGKKFIEKENIYQLKDISSGVNLPASVRSSDSGNAFPALIETRQKFYEGQSEAGKSTSMTFGYDAKGNVTSYTDFGDEGDDDNISSSITYHTLADKYLLEIPQRIVVTGSGVTYRKRESVIDPNTGDIKQIKQFLSDTEFSTYDMEYDEFGNLKKMTRPKNAKDQRLSFDYVYDNDAHTYVIKVSNSYGYSSEAVYDLRFGQVLTSKDMNGNEITYQLDNVGRIARITGPYEKGGNGYTLKFEYHHDAAVPWALTRHFDQSDPKNDMLTVIFADGMGKVLQTKKDVAIYAGEGKADTEMMMVSGRVKFDAFGRTVSALYPITEPSGTPGTFNPTEDTVKPTLTTYDVLNRALTVTLPDQSVTTTAYGFESDRSGKKQFSTKTTDANGKQTEQFTDVKDRVTAVKNYTSDKPVWTSFKYNAINEQVEATDDQGHTTFSVYDNLGRRISRKHPDAGTTSYSYDLAGNLRELVTANLQKEGHAITYSYDFERLTEITYPQNPENNVRYTYGEGGASDNRAGRVVLQEDASGAQEFFYGPLGEVVKNVRTVVLPKFDEQTYVTEWKYDTWNRLTSMVYADGEEVSYTYNAGGLLKSMAGKKKNATFNYVSQLGYDKFEQRVFLAYGNGTKTTYAFEPDRRRLKNMTAATAAKRLFMDNSYTYDKVNNILGQKNSAPIPSPNLMGGSSDYSFEYDDLYRLTKAEGMFKGPNDVHTYSLSMEYNSVGGITHKVQNHQRKGNVQKKTSYDLSYTYSSEQPHAPVHIGEQTYSYDANGNQTGWTDDKTGQRRNLMWDEENRIRSIYDNGSQHHYIYDASGERVIKAKSIGQRVFVNGEWKAGSGQMGNYTVYVNPYLVLRSGGYTKHYYIEGQRIVSKLGGGWDNNGKGPLKAGGSKVDYVGKSQKIFDGIVKNLKFLGADGQILTAGKSGKIPPGQIKGNGTGSTPEKFQYFYHPDHLGSTSYVTDATGEVYQHLEYFAFGETFVEEHSNTDRTPFLFNGKELDEETGLYYYGIRYYDPRTSVWLSVDPKAEKFPGWSPYNYCLNNPVAFVDAFGEEPTPYPKSGLGSVDYYRFRYNDFKKQNPNGTPPDYYLNYGDKYIRRFTNETNKTLSLQGKEWLVKARKNLQVAIEDKLQADPTIESRNNGEDFRKFAFDSHVDAYWNAGLYKLETLDLVKILMTPDAKDLFSEDGLRQVAAMGGKFLDYYKDNPSVLKQRLLEAFRDRKQIQKLIEEKAKKEGVPVEKIKKLLSPIPLLEL